MQQCSSEMPAALANYNHMLKQAVLRQLLSHAQTDNQYILKKIMSTTSINDICFEFDDKKFKLDVEID